jgi:hypothetical protein
MLLVHLLRTCGCCGPRIGRQIRSLHVILRRNSAGASALAPPDADNTPPCKISRGDCGDPDADLETGKLVARLADDSCSGFDGPNRTTIGGIDLMGRSLTAALRKTAFVRRSAFGRRRVGMDSVALRIWAFQPAASPSSSRRWLWQHLDQAHHSAIFMFQQVAVIDKCAYRVGVPEVHPERHTWIS